LVVAAGMPRRPLTNFIIGCLIIYCEASILRLFGAGGYVFAPHVRAAMTASRSGGALRVLACRGGLLASGWRRPALGRGARRANHVAPLLAFQFDPAR